MNIQLSNIMIKLRSLWYTSQLSAPAAQLLPNKICKVAMSNTFVVRKRAPEGLLVSAFSKT